MPTVMTTTELGACEWFVWDLRRSNLIDRGQLDQLVTDFMRKNTRAEPPALAQFMVDQGIVSPFQAERLLQGKINGLVLGPYTVVDALGSGSMGTVYKASSKNDNEWYAVKVLPRRSMWNVRIARRQVRVFEKVQHPAVVPFVDVGTAGGTHYLAWPFVEGETLDHIVERSGKLPAGLAAGYALQTAEGLEACHRHGIAHGLLKPSNLMITSNNEVRILDLGIGSILASSEAESLVDTMSTANSLTSGLDCASPECIIDPNKRTPAGDQYSLGCIMYYCLSGQYPFPDCTAVEKMMWHQSKEPTPILERNPNVPQGLGSVIERLMKKAPEARYGSMMAVTEALQPFADVSQGVVQSVKRVPVSAASKGMRAFQKQSVGNEAARTPWKPPPSAIPRLAPARDSLQYEAVMPPAPRAPVQRMPVFMPGQDEPVRTLEDRLGPAGVFIGAVMAACLTWLVSLWLFR
jgi:serine/threonine-protein kinase